MFKTLNLILSPGNNWYFTAALWQRINSRGNAEQNKDSNLIYFCKMPYKEWSKNRQVQVTEENRSTCVKHVTAHKFELWNILQLKNLHRLQQRQINFS